MDKIDRCPVSPEISGSHRRGTDVDARVGEIETALKAFENRPATFEPDEVARAGVFVSIDLDGEARIERGFVKAEKTNWEAL